MTRFLYVVCFLSTDVTKLIMMLDPDVCGHLPYVLHFYLETI